MAHEEPESMPGDGLDWLEDEDSLTEVVDEEQIQDEAANAWLAAEEAYVPIDDGNGYLAVGGAEAGSVVSALPAGSAPTGTSTAPVIAGRDDALTGDRPIYLVHRGARHANFLPIVMGDLHHKKGRSLTIGAVANLPSAKAGTTSAFSIKRLLRPFASRTRSVIALMRKFFVCHPPQSVSESWVCALPREYRGLRLVAASAGCAASRWCQPSSDSGACAQPG